MGDHSLTGRARQLALWSARELTQKKWVKEWLHDLGVRPMGHSTLVWFREHPGCHTRLTFRNYFSLNYGIPNPEYRFTLHDEDGHRAASWTQTLEPDETVVVDSAEVLSRFGLGREFEGSLAAEVQHVKLDPQRFLRVNVDYYNEAGFVTTVHDQGRLVRLPRADSQSLVYVREDAEFETSIALQNWFRYKRRPSEYIAEARIELLNAQGQSRVASAPPIPACATRLVRIRDLFPDAPAFLAGQAGGLKVHSNIAMGRSIPVLKSLRTGHYAVNHTVGDHNPDVYTRDTVSASTARHGVWAPVWASMVRETDDFSTSFSFFNNWLPANTYSVDVRLFDPSGRIVAFAPAALTLQAQSTGVLNLRELLASEGVPTPFDGMLEARLAPIAGQDDMPGPGMLQADTLWTSHGSVTQSNNQSLGHANSPLASQHYLSPKRSKMFGRVLSTDRYETMLSLMYLSSEETFGGPSETEVSVCDASGRRRQSVKLAIAPHGSVWRSFDELFPNLPEFLSESRGVSTCLVLDKTVKLVGYLGVRDRVHGTLGMDHLFGG